MKESCRNLKLDRWFYALCGLTFLLRIYASLRFPLTGDEAYYLIWARHLSWGYYDHPPMVAWLIRLSTSILGSNPTAVRFFALLMGGVTPVIFYLTLKKLSPEKPAAFLGGLLFLSAPFAGVYFFIIYPDAPLLFFWALSLYYLVKTGEPQSRNADWLLLGLFLGLGLLSKLNFLIFLGGMGIYYFFKPPQWQKLRLTGLTFVLTILPYLLWNIGNHFAPWNFQLYQRHLPSAHVPMLKYFLSFWLEQAGVFNPILFLLLLASIGLAFKKGLTKLEPAWLLGLCFFLPGFLIFAGFSLHEEIQPNWLVTDFLGAFLLLALLYRDTSRAWVRALTWGGLFLALLLYGLLNFALLHPEVLFGLSEKSAARDYRGNHLTEIYGYQPLGRELKRLRISAFPGQVSFVFTESYQLSSLLNFYSGDFTYLLSRSLNGREYHNWQKLEELQGRPGIFLNHQPLEERGDIRDLLLKHFSRLEPLPSLAYYYRGHLTRYFYPVKCYDFRPDAQTHGYQFGQR